MYQALYRKWRPQTFDDVVGQSHITETLRRQVEAGRLSHAYIFVGTRGTGKTTCAKILSKAANCAHPVNGNPCNECDSCRGIDSGAILDVTELDAASNNGVDNIRALRDEAIYTPASVKKRVYIIDEVHMLSVSAFNALLKILEEPPEHLIFILATTELNKVPATILSRCQRFSFKRITPQQTAERMKYISSQENINLTDEAAELLSILADGSMRDALSLLDQCTGSEIVDEKRVRDIVGLAGAGDISAIMDSIISGDAAECLKKLDRIYMDGKEVSSLLSELLSLYRDALISKIAKDGAEQLLSGLFSRETLRKVTDSIPAKRLIRGQALLEESISTLSRSSEAKIHAEMCLVMLCDETLMPGYSGLEARISRLEAGAAAPSSQPIIKETAKKAEAETPIETTVEFSDAPFDTTGARIIGQRVPEKDVSGKKKEDVSGNIVTLASDKAAVFEENPVRSESTGQFSGDEWQVILSAVKDRISRPAFTFLSNSLHCAVSIEGSTLTIGAKSKIAKNLIDTTEVKLGIKEAAEGVLKKPVAVFVSDYDESSALKAETAAPEEDKLDQLKKFSNITFE